MDRSSIVRLAALGYMTNIQKQAVDDGNRLRARAAQYRNLPVPALQGMLFEDADVLKRNLRCAALRPFEHYRTTFHEGRPHDKADVERCIGSWVRTRYQHKLRSTPEQMARDFMSRKYQGQVAVVPRGERRATLDAVARRAARLGQDAWKIEVEEASVNRAELAKIIQDPNLYARTITGRSLATMACFFTAADALANAIPIARESIRHHRLDANPERPSKLKLVHLVVQDVGREVLPRTLFSLVDAVLALTGNERARLALQVLPIIQHELTERLSGAK